MADPDDDIERVDLLLLSGPGAAQFLDRVLEWLIERKDPRAVPGPGNRWEMHDPPGCCAEFCRYMADAASARERN